MAVEFMSYDESDEEESSSNDYTHYSENICLVISKLWFERDKHTNTDYALYGWMICVIPHIVKDVFKNSNRKHINQVNTVIKTLFGGSHEKELHETLDTFWSKYTHFNHNNYPFESKNFIWSSKDIRGGNSHLQHQKYSLISTKVLVFVACGVTSKMLGVGSAERSCGDVKTIKSGKVSALGNDIS